MHVCNYRQEATLLEFTGKKVMFCKFAITGRKATLVKFASKKATV